MKQNKKQLDKIKEKTDKKITTLKEAIQNIIAINIYIPDKGHYPISCLPSDLFTTVIKKLNTEFPELKKKKFYFIANGGTVNIKETLKNNKIKSGNEILLHYID